jgi:hypothetical protein
MEEFLNSKAMLTPGVAGGSTTLITATLVNAFGLPGNWTALAISFLFGMVVWFDKRVPLGMRGFFYIISSFIIFTTANGVNEAGVAIVKSREQVQYESRWVPPDTEKESLFQSWF